jgi:hypothetical protein
LVVRDASLGFVSCIEIVFVTQMLHSAAATPHELQGLYPDFDMPFDIEAFRDVLPTGLRPKIAARPPCVRQLMCY